jgi:hypothetical protein
MRDFEFAKTLTEINMRPSVLRKAAGKSGASAGLEFEMIVPVSVEDRDSRESEPDYDQDTRAEDIDEVISFFNGNDANAGRQLRDLRSELYSEFQSWQDDQLENDWSRNIEVVLRDYAEINDTFDRDEAKDLAREQIAEANPELHPDSSEFDKLVDNLVKELFDDYISDLIRDPGSRTYENARDEYFEENRDDYSEVDFFRDQYPYMTDIESNFDISWPFYTDPESSSSLDAIKEVAIDFMRAMGQKKIAVGEDYHGPYYKYSNGDWGYVGNRKPTDCYTIEPDGSLDPDNSDESGLEFVSPPLPIEQMAEDIRKVKKWAGRYGCYTNDSTGLHMNVSVPGLETESLDFDYTKLALLLGDKHILEMFGRAANTYAKSAFDKIAKVAIDRPNATADAMKKLQQGLSTLAGRALHGNRTDKYTSINVKDDYIEFRSPGGNYLERDPEELINTLNRFVVALEAAKDPEAYKKEYTTKLYKLLNPKGLTDPYGDMLREFSNYVTGVGGASNTTVKQFRTSAMQYLKQQNITRRPDPNKKYEWSVSVPRSSYGFETYNAIGSTPDEALQEVANRTGFDFDALKRLSTVTLIGPVKQEPARNTGNWGIYIPTIERFAKNSETSEFYRFNTKEEAQKFLANYMANNIGARNDLEVREMPSVAQATSREQRWQEYRVYLADRPEVAVGTFIGTPDPHDTRTRTAFMSFLSSIGRSSPAGYGYEAIPTRPAAAPRQSAPQQTPQATQPRQSVWHILSSESNEPVEIFSAANREDALQQYNSWLSDNYNPAIRYRLVAATDPNTPVTAGIPNVNWEIYNRITGRTAYTLSAPTFNDAWARAREWAERATQANIPNFNPSDYSVRRANESA